MTVWAPLKYLLAAILLLMLGLTPFSRAVRGGVSAFFGPFVFGFYKISQGLVSEVYFWKDLRGLAVENTLLQKQVAYLKSQTVRLDETARENEVLKKQFNGKINDWQGDLIMARVLGWGQTTAASSKTIILNKGTTQGLLEGDPVILDGNLVGQIVQVYENSALCRLASDSNFKAAVVTQKSRVFGTIAGDFGTKLRLEHILQAENLDTGEAVITSGMDGKFPKGLVVGFVESVTSAPSAVEKTAVINSAISFTRLEEVFIWKKGQ
ncbi:rod shape-determining protein MreC [candidate division WWE3 bacterium CG08_land_8_20_14_0_20_40_13]|uniref:Cell shape-determining protein MreC n=1 Tax=candidate division WWE3 bacterium CG08_land_8_20_14_0_20_40_13 TaxID=1975084 RepID=A0A2H0XEY8_UNCKA|nr:MAG: rod shape-determining protein MreC [candidate division WWE3 bacterium CG08_land_8_20_14_0_20_40_13]